MGKISLIIIIFGDNLKTTSVLFFIADFNLLSCEFYSFPFKPFYWAILYFKFKLSYNKTFTVPFEKFKTVSFASSIMKNNFVFSVLSKFTVKLICWLKSTAIIS